MMQKQAIVNSGTQLLASIRTQNSNALSVQKGLSRYRLNEKTYPEDVYAWLCCVLALKAVSQDTFGVGGLLIDVDGDVIAQGHNEIFSSGFRSDLHAEMVVMNQFENNITDYRQFTGYRLITSLEPCPMCTVRLITSGVNEIAYVAEDLEGGMVRTIENLPSFWKMLARKTHFRRAQCSPDIVQFSEQIFQLNLEQLVAKL